MVPPEASLAQPTVEWTVQFGTSEFDNSCDVATDTTGGIYITGCSYGNLCDSQDRSGTLLGRARLLSRRFDKVGESRHRTGADVYLRKYDTGGNCLWTRQFGSSDGRNDWGFAVATHESGDNCVVYVTGRTMGIMADTGSNAGEADAWLAKYDANGNRVWLKQFGSPTVDWGMGLAVSGGHVYITGSTDGVLDPEHTNAFVDDAWLAKYDADGNQLWLKQFGESLSEWGNDVAVDDSDGIYLTGISSFIYPYGPGDVWLAKYDASGNQQWLHEFSSTGLDNSMGVAVIGIHHIYITGATTGDLFQANAGKHDAFLVALAPAQCRRANGSICK
jgi:hypothetical protein